MTHDLSDAGWQPSSRYPDPAIRVLDPRFESLRMTSAAVERLYTGSRWAEGPVWFGDGRYLLWSDVPNDRILKWEEASGAVSVFRQPSNYANGHTRDERGRLVSCEHLTRRVTRTEYDGSITVIADSYQGKRLNSPNDVVVKSDGTIWFTDPPYGIINWYEGSPAPQELPACVYRVDPDTLEITMVADDSEGPNGLVFSPDESLLYVVESRAKPRRIRVYQVDEHNRLHSGRMLIDCGPGTADGFRVDVAGNLWCGWGMGRAGLDGVRVFAPDGTAIGHIDLPERCANLCFGGRHGNRLFMASSRSLYSLYVNTQGAAWGRGKPG
ncbi:SMP-30/gluconolactonase/LRE family protein [Candidimonas nitroreducens]|uniref:Gluconolactonase n=1 Tax=Candidimonas nitroreducens TaxID=683354 RepID=A0A225MRF6_9BURK|nr:SMP-30/gluconolactonase/LRE family protein [Candidimonas nitroreducens]OWT63836.1 gluconolactonase [Candidimonas nitroreducens]